MKPKKILIVEDDDFSRGVVEKLLESSNYETCSCCSGGEGLASLKQQSFDVLITDLHMPGMDGFELIRKARMIHPGLPTILITGFSGEEVRDKAKEEKVDGFFSKPVDWDALYLLLGTLSGSEKIRNKDMSLSVSGRKRPFQPRGIIFALILFILILFGIQPSKAQPPFHPQNKPMLRMDGQDAYWKSSDLDLTEAQKKTLGGLQRAYASEALPLRMELMSLRFELRHLIQDPNVQPKILLDRQKKISELQAKLDDLSLSYQIKARSILTKEQLDRLPQDCLLEMGIGYGAGVGIGRGPRRGPRW
jgi:CheY-like chemotaxis protein